MLFVCINIKWPCFTDIDTPAVDKLWSKNKLKCRAQFNNTSKVKINKFSV